MTRFYGQDVSQWNGAKKFWAWRDMDRIIAWELWKNPESSGHLRGNQLYDLVLLATRSKRIADAEARAREDLRIRQNKEP